MDYNEFAEKIKTKYPQYKDMDNKQLAEKMIAKYPQYSDVTFDTLTEEKKGIDLTPSGLVKQATAAVGAPLRAAIRKETIPQAYKRAREIQEESALNKLSPVVDLGAYTAIPSLKVGGKALQFGGNALLQGGVPMGIEALKEGENAGQGVATGTGIAAGIQAGLPLAGKVANTAIKVAPTTANLLARSIGRIQPETLQRAIQADSKALDLTKEQAQNLLMDTTERVQNTYDDLLRQRGQEVGEVAKGLNDTGARINVDDLAGDITETFNKYQGDVVNPARNMTGTLEDDLIELAMSGADEAGTVSPVDLNKLKQQVGHMTNWSDAIANNYQNPILEQIYGKWGNRLNDLSPELAQANSAYAKLRNFQKNEGLKRILKPGDNIDTASSALRNYNNTVTKGNTNRNIQDLEQLFIQEGKQPFLNDIDDVNAAMDLLNARSTGDSWLANITTQLSRPVLKGVRDLNRAGIPQKINSLNEKISPAVRRILTPLAVKATAPMLYGGVEYNEY